MKQGSPGKPTLTWNHPHIFCIGKPTSCRESTMRLPPAWGVSAVPHSPCIEYPQLLRCKASGSRAGPAPSSSNKARDREQKGTGECRTWTGQHYDRQTTFLPIIPSTGRHTERSTYPSQCRDKAEKFSAQKRLKVPAGCTGTCLPPATSSSLQPHNTASSQRPSGSWAIPATEERTAQMNATGAENQRMLTQKTGSLCCFHLCLKTTLAKLITFEYRRDRRQ